MNRTLSGLLCGIFAAVCYGTNPFGALSLYKLGFNIGSVLVSRFGFAFMLLAICMFVAGERFRISLKAFSVLASLGLLFSCSSFSMFLSFQFMDAGIASTLLFIYPIFVAIMMGVFFHERIRWFTITSIILALMGVAMLYQSEGGETLSGKGIALVMLAALCDASYVVILNRSHLEMSAVKLNFYVLLVCFIANIGFLLYQQEPMMFPNSVASISYIIWLAIVPSSLAAVLQVHAVHRVGSTITAILGSLEPLTAVLIGIALFQESFSIRKGLGILLILSAVTLLAASQKRSPRMTQKTADMIKQM